MDDFDFQNLFGFGRISQIYIIFLDIYVKQICGIWRRLFEFNKLAFFISPGDDIDCLYQQCLYWCTDAYVECACIFCVAGVSRLPAILSECVICHSEILQYLSETLRKIGGKLGQNLQNVLSEKLYFLCEFGVDVTNILLIVHG